MAKNSDPFALTDASQRLCNRCNHVLAIDVLDEPYYTNCGCAEFRWTGVRKETSDVKVSL